MINVNFSKETEKIIDTIKEEAVKSSLLLHACCAPCSSYVIEYLSKYFNITIYYYNPNISPVQEYKLRLDELNRLLKEMKAAEDINILPCDYEGEVFTQIAKGLEKEAEGGERCFKCYRLRLEKTAVAAKDNGFDFFTTTLSISPYKNADKLNEIGKELAEKYNISYLYSDFKKKNGYKRSIELSKEFNLYRQDYCGCVFSKNNK